MQTFATERFKQTRQRKTAFRPKVRGLRTISESPDSALDVDGHARSFYLSSDLAGTETRLRSDNYHHTLVEIEAQTYPTLQRALSSVCG